MNSYYAGALGIAAALAATLVETDSAQADTTVPEAQTRRVKKDDPLDPAPRAGEHELKTAAMTKLCDTKCQLMTFTEETIPDLGASRVLYTLLYPGKIGLDIPKPDGTVAVTITVMPTKVTRGKGLVAMGTF